MRSKNIELIKVINVFTFSSWILRKYTTEVSIANVINMLTLPIFRWLLSNCEYFCSQIYCLRVGLLLTEMQSAGWSLLRNGKHYSYLKCEQVTSWCFHCRLVHFFKFVLGTYCWIVHKNADRHLLFWSEIGNDNARAGLVKEVYGSLAKGHYHQFKQAMHHGVIILDLLLSKLSPISFDCLVKVSGWCLILCVHHLQLGSPESWNGCFGWMTPF